MMAGLTQAIVDAHLAAEPAYLDIAQGELLGANINRSPSAYLANDDATLYKHNVDKNMTLLKIRSLSGE